MVGKFSGIMIDTLKKRSDSVFDIVNFTELNIIKKFALENKCRFRNSWFIGCFAYFVNQPTSAKLGWIPGRCMLEKRSGPCPE